MQQITNLIRTKLLLKARRPKSTCCEFLLPLVLFGLLCFLRWEYNKSVIVFPDRRKGHEAIFPISRRLLMVAEGTVGDWFSGEDTTYTNFAEQALCNTSFGAATVELLEYIVSPSLEAGKSVVDRLMEMNPDTIAKSVTEWVRYVQMPNISGYSRLANETRRQLLDSDWMRKLENDSAVLDGELRQLLLELDGTDDDVLSYVKATESISKRWLERNDGRVKGWVHDICNLQGDLFEKSNATALAQALVEWSSLMEDFANSLDTALDSVADWFANSSLFGDWGEDLQAQFDFFQLTDLKQTRRCILENRKAMEVESLDPEKIAGCFNATRSLVDARLGFDKFFNVSSLKEIDDNTHSFFNVSGLLQPDTLNELRGKVNASTLVDWLLGHRVPNVSESLRSADESLSELDYSSKGKDVLSELVRWQEEADQTLALGDALSSFIKWLNKTSSPTLETASSLDEFIRDFNRTYWSTVDGPPGDRFFEALGTSRAGFTETIQSWLREDLAELQLPQLNESGLWHHVMPGVQKLLNWSRDEVFSVIDIGTYDPKQGWARFRKALAEGVDTSLKGMIDWVEKTSPKLAGTNFSTQLQFLDAPFFHISHFVQGNSGTGRVLEILSSMFGEEAKLVDPTLATDQLLRLHNDGQQVAGFMKLLHTMKDENLTQVFQTQFDNLASRAQMSAASVVGRSQVTFFIEFQRKLEWFLREATLSDILSMQIDGSQLLGANLNSYAQEMRDGNFTRFAGNLSQELKVFDHIEQALAKAEAMQTAMEGFREFLPLILGEERNLTLKLLVDDTRQAVSELKRTAAEVERDVLPEWKESWQRRCKSVNGTKVAGHFLNLLLDHVRESSFFVNLTRRTRDMLSQVDLEGWRVVLEGWQYNIRKYTPEEFGGHVRTKLTRLQNFVRGLELQQVEPADVTETFDRILGCPERPVEEKPKGPGLNLGNNSGLIWKPRPGTLPNHSVVVEEEEEEVEPEEPEKQIDAGTNFLANELMRRRFLLAPFKGEVKKLWDLVMVELAVTATETEAGLIDHYAWVKFLARMPIFKALTVQGLTSFFKGRVLTFETERELETWAIDNPDDVFAGIVFRSADEDGNFPADLLDVEYSIRLHAQLLPSTSKILRTTQFSLFGNQGIPIYYYIDFGFAYLQETIGRAVGRFRATREAVTGRGPGNSIKDQNLWVPEQRERSLRSQVAVNMFAFEVTVPLRKIAVGVEQFPSPKVTLDLFIYIIQHLMPLFMMLGWVYALSLLVKEMVYEKQEHLREVMRIQGLRTWVYWLSWLVFAMVQLTVLVTLMMIMLVSGNVLQHSNHVLIFIFLWLFSFTVVSFAMLVSACFQRAKVACVCAGVAYYSAYLPFHIYQRFEETLSLSSKCGLCLLSPTGMAIGISHIARWELVHEGLQWNTIGLPPPLTNTGAAPNNDFCVAHIFVLFVVDAVVYTMLAWYIDKVFPGELGLSQPWYFPFQPSYWRATTFLQAPGADASQDEGGRLETVDAVIDDCRRYFPCGPSFWRSIAFLPAPVARHGNPEQDDNARLESYEAAPADLTVTVQIRKLEKSFPNGKKAVKGVSLDMHKGTILGLLGHNGAGKSTTMAILTGLYAPSEGDVFVNGRSVRRDSPGVRRQLGVCLQHNALYEVLSVEEHLKLFCNLKCVPTSQVQSEVDSLLLQTGLEPKRRALTEALSGGMKRKLSIGIALCGGSRVIALDEPTAGVDATSRRDIWHLLAAHKPNRAILLSTHFMDEADMLSDRIAIIAEGELTAIGSSIGLKRHFADRYLLTVVVTDDASDRTLLAAVKWIVPDAKCVGSRGREFSYALPCSARAKFAALFSSWQDENTRRLLGIETYGLSAATMEEVFLQASSVHEEGLGGAVRNNQEEEEAEDQNSNKPTRSLDEVSTASPGDSDVRSLPSHSTQNGNGITFSFNEFETSKKPPTSKTLDNVIALKPPDVDERSIDSMPAPEAEPAQDPAQVAPARLVSGMDLVYQQFRSRLAKRALSARRDRKAWASQLLFPAIFVLIALTIAALLQADDGEPPLKLSTDMFVGAVSGSYGSAVETNYIPFVNSRNDSVSNKVLASFNRVKGAGDEFVPLKGTRHGYDGTLVLRQYILDQSRELRAGSYTAMSIVGGAPTTNVTMWFDNRASHAIPALVCLASNARLNLIGYSDSKVQVWNHPLPETKHLFDDEMTGNNPALADLTVALTVLLAMGFIPASFVVYLVHERGTNGKHQQLISGMSPVTFWMSNYVWDLINYLIPVSFIFMLFLIFQLDAYSGSNSFACLCLLLLYGTSMTPLMYCAEPLFRTPSTAYVGLIVANLFSGSTAVMAATVLDLYNTPLPFMDFIQAMMEALCPYFLPNYCLGRGLMKIATNHYTRFAQEELGVNLFDVKDAMDWDVSGKYITKMAMMSFVWLFVRILIEWRFFSRFLVPEYAHTPGEKSKVQDEGVVREEIRVKGLLLEARSPRSPRLPRERSSNDDACLLLSELSKSFVPFTLFQCSPRCRPQATHSVRGISVAVAGGECFGLLGVNGAGKTTTMRMITGDLEADGGDVRLSGWSMKTDRDQARRHLGYCPQFDALPDLLTAREALNFYAQVRGVPASKSRQVVESIISRMCLEAHQHRLCKHLSGGNKRKLSTAIALIGEPDVVLLDEPSTGVDVGARRFLWDVLGEIRLRGHALVLTSHSMDECEVLCTRLTIMATGEMKCLGTPLQLKAKYGGGYTLVVKALPPKPELDTRECIRKFMSTVPRVRLAEENVGLFRYRLGAQDNEGENVPLADIFAKVEGAISPSGELHGCVLDYTISQTSLEEVFLHFSQM